jgi:hypothetical protein
MGALADLYTDTTETRFCAGMTRIMSSKKWTPDEYRAWRKARNARLRELRDHIRRIEAELAARRTDDKDT